MRIVQIKPDSDTFNALSSPNTSYDNNPGIFVIDNPPTDRFNAFIRLDLNAALPANANIISCKMNLYNTNPTVPVTVNMYDCIRPTAIFTQLTWNEYKTGSPWTTPGGDFGALIDSQSISNGMNQFDLTAYAKAQYAAGNPIFAAYKAMNAGTVSWLAENQPSFNSYFIITFFIKSSRADLGHFRLGWGTLGAGPLRGDIREEITISDNIHILANIFLTENIFITENLNGTTYAYFNETLTITEAQSYLSDYLAGVKGTIAGALDLTPTDYCATIEESGQQLYLNGIVERAHIFTKQTSQKFNIDVKILPGDAVMFTCPDLVVVVGDEVSWDGKLFKVAESINHYFADTIMYVKHALQRVRYTQPVPQVLGLVASENLKGKTTLTWLEINFPTFDHYEVWESLVGGAIPDPITSILTTTGTLGNIVNSETITSVSTTGPGPVLIETGATYAAGKYTAGETINIQGSDGNDGDYILTAYNDNGGFDELTLTLTKAWDISGALGKIIHDIAINSVSATGPDEVIIGTGVAYAAGRYSAGDTIRIRDSDENDGDYTLKTYNNNGGFDELILELEYIWKITGTITIKTGAIYDAGKYIPGGTISIQGSNGNDRDYVLTTYQDNGGFDELILTLTKAWDIIGALGDIVNLTNYYKKDTTKSNGLTVKNLIPFATYYYLVRAVDKYGNPGWWSNQADCAVDTTKPTKVEGLR